MIHTQKSKSILFFELFKRIGGYGKLTSIVMIVQASIKAAIGQWELESMIQVQLKFVFSILFEMPKLSVQSTLKVSRNKKYEN